MLGRWLQERRLRRLRDRARTLDPPALADDVADLRTAAREGDDRTRTLAVEALSALARAGAGDGGEDEQPPTREASVPERATTALVDALPFADDALAADALRTLRYVVTERPDSAVADRLDAPFAAAVDGWDHAAHRRVCVDAGVLLRAGVAMPETRAALWTALEGGPPAVRTDASLAYLQVAATPGVLDDPAAVAAGLHSVAAGREPFPPQGSAARALADGRTVEEAARLLSEA